MLNKYFQYKVNNPFNVLELYVYMYSTLVGLGFPGHTKETNRAMQSRPRHN